MRKRISIFGCGDVGLRIARRLCESGIDPKGLVPVVRSLESRQKLLPEFSEVMSLDLDAIQLDDKHDEINSILRNVSELYYLVPPQKSGTIDHRTKRLLTLLAAQGVCLRRIVLISTTGVYGDHQGDFVTEDTPINPSTPRSQRRANMEQQWLAFAEKQQCILSILRVPGIYSFSRLPRKRLEAQAPIVDPQQCGFTNRIHADDLAMVCEIVMNNQTKTDIYNVTDGTPGKMSQYFIDVANFLDIPIPKILSFAEAEAVVTNEMMSYLRESRKISNNKLLETFNLKLNYKDYREGMRF